jgi:hypothetical protein
VSPNGFSGDGNVSSGDLHVAYQVFGEGAVNVVVAPFGSNRADLMWSVVVMHPAVRRSPSRGDLSLDCPRNVDVSALVEATTLRRWRPNSAVATSSTRSDTPSSRGRGLKISGGANAAAKTRLVKGVLVSLAA